MRKENKNTNRFAFVSVQLQNAETAEEPKNNLWISFAKQNTFVVKMYWWTQQ